MTKNQFLKTVFVLNESFFKEKGFVTDKKTFEFIKKDENGYEKIQISCAKVGTRFYLTYGLILRINRLNELINPFSGTNEVYWKERGTILISSVYLKLDINNKQYSIDKDEDIPIVNNDFVHLMNEKGFAWFDKYRNNIAVLDTELNGNKPVYPEYIQLIMKPIYGIAAAYLNKNPGFNEIVKKHLMFWEEKAKANPVFKNDMERIKNLIKHLKEI